MMVVSAGGLVVSAVSVTKGSFLLGGGEEAASILLACRGGEEGLAGGVGDIGGDFRCSGLGVIAGFSVEEGGTTMCLGLRGLNFLTTFCFVVTSALLFLTSAGMFILEGFDT